MRIFGGSLIFLSLSEKLESDQILKVKKALKATATQQWDEELLDLWQKSWRVAFIFPHLDIRMEP